MFDNTATLSCTSEMVHACCDKKNASNARVYVSTSKIIWGGGGNADFYQLHLAQEMSLISFSLTTYTCSTAWFLIGRSPILICDHIYLTLRFDF